MKRIFFITLAVLAVVYLVGSIIWFGKKNSTQISECTKVEIIIADSLEKQFLTKSDIITTLNKSNIYPLNKTNINTQAIENVLLKNNIIETCEVVKTVSGTVQIIITQKQPVLRVFSASESYYIDKYGQIMPTISGHGIYVPIASGNIEKSFAMMELYKFSLFLQGDKFWNDQIVQIFVRSEKDIELVPRVGNHRILLGSLDDYKTKLEHLRLFYEQAIPKTGWEKYSVINLKYRNQIVCTKK